MTTEPSLLDWAQVRALDPATTALWVSGPVAALVRGQLAFPTVARHATPAPGTPTVVVAGGGKLIDGAKLWRHRHSPATRLVAVPTLWGSGAEASPVAVEMVDGRKVPHLGAHLLPDARAVWPELAAHVPETAARDGYGDVWSHAIEGLLSPLATDDLRQQAAHFIRDGLLPTPFERDTRWFELSARASQLQSRSSVGLVHGLAHELEPLRETQLALGPGRGGHAHLCALFLWPVLRFNAARSAKVLDLAGRWGLDWAAIEARARQLHDRAEFDRMRPVVAQAWPAILRNPMTRTNVALVRPDALQSLMAAAQ